ncbi:hypothetical protein [Luteimonas sp. e5]
MNAIPSRHVEIVAPPHGLPSPASAAGVPLPRRERDLGVGYGRSSGYADGLRRYVAPVAPALFRVR